MEEKEYYCNKLIALLDSNKGKNIAVYVKGEFVFEIWDCIINSEIKCFVSDENIGGYIRGYYIISLEQMSDLRIDILIIAASFVETKEVYSRIRRFGYASANLLVYNLYGANVSLLCQNVLEKNIEYPKLWEKSVQYEIDTHEVICFDIENTLFTSKYLVEKDFWEELEAEISNRGIKIEFLADKIQRYQDDNKYMTIHAILREIIEDSGMDLTIFDKILGIVKEELKKNFVPRKSMIEVVQETIDKGKIICFVNGISTYRVSATFWKEMLKDCGIENFDDIFCSYQLGKDKTDGLYRIIKERYSDKSCLYIGDDEELDIFLPQMYNINTFLIKSAYELYLRLDPIAFIRAENKRMRRLLEKYVITVYNPDYIMYKAEQNRVAALDLAKKLENRARFESSDDETIMYKPFLFEDVQLEKDIKRYPQLVFNKSENPEVTIIIPVYNEFGYTYNCLKAILEHTDNVDYEVIVADDCSNDQVCELEKVVMGVQIIHNRENMRFLLNCNNASHKARGKYLLFLNNDTQVQKNWLKPLVDLVEQQNVGMVGSKMVYPNGRLQEAGGILWKDGSAWNYGHMKNPDEPEFNYVKDVDYISGASIMISASLWNEIGGFDARFVPAYYEDTDLAFEVRKRGYRVLYQPQSVVVHFEGVTNGTDTSSGLKNFQVANKDKFYDKWKAILKRDHFSNGENVYLAKDRGQTKKQILVIDHYVPNFDRDAGGRCTFMYIKMFVRMGFKVTFIGDNFYKGEPYTSILQQMGVEVLYGNYYYNHWKEWLEGQLQYFDYIYLQRPHISIKYIDIVKEYAKGKIFYFAHDLHHIRLYRDYQITGNKESLLESERWKRWNWSYLKRQMLDT